MVRIRSNDHREIPLFLLPHVVAKQIKLIGDRIYRISVKRTHWHHYNVSVRTKALPRELGPGCVISSSSGIPVPPGSRGTATGAEGGSS